MTAGLSDELDLTELVREIQLYLSAVDLFRGLGYEPRWRHGS